MAIVLDVENKGIDPLIVDVLVIMSEVVKIVVI